MSRRIDGIEVDEFEARATLAADSFACDHCGERFPGAALYGDGCDLCRECAERADDSVASWLAAGAEANARAEAEVELQHAAQQILNAVVARSLDMHEAREEGEAAE